MSAGGVLLHGKPVVRAIESELGVAISRLRERTIVPCMALVAVAPSTSDLFYAEKKKRMCERLGIRFRLVSLPGATRTDELIQRLHILGRDPGVHGILLQYPLPRHIDAPSACAAITPAKDIDLSVEGAKEAPFKGRWTERGPCAVEAILRILEHHAVPVDRQVVVVAGSDFPTKSLSKVLHKRGACVDTYTAPQLKGVKARKALAQSEIVVVAAGRPGFFKGEGVGRQSVIVDAGYFNEGGAGDVDLSSILPRVRAVVPVPGGIGPVTIALLLERTVLAAQE